MGNKALDIFGSIVVLAIVTTLVLPKRQTPAVIKALFSGFSGSIKAASGR